MTALSVVILSLSNFIPILAYASPLFAGLLLIGVIDELGEKWGWMAWAAVSLLALVLLADKETAAFYIFTGFYPMLKPKLEKIKPKLLRIAVKLTVFSAVIGLMYALLIFIFRLDTVLSDFRAAGMILNMISFIVLILILMIYDMLIEKMRILYNKRIKPKIKINLKAILLFLAAGFMMVGNTDNSYAGTKAVTYFGNEWPVNFLNSEHAQAEEDFEKIKGDGFNTVIYCVPWREVQPGNNGEFDDDALAKLDEMIGRAGTSGLSVKLRLGYTWDYADYTSSLNRFNSLFKNSQYRSNWMKYAKRVFDISSAHSNFTGGFITWEDFWNSLAFNYSGYAAMDENLMKLLSDTQEVFPGLSMECRLHNDMSGGKPYSHEKTFGCADAPYSTAMLAVSMGFPDGSVVDPAEAAAMSSRMICRMQAAGKPVFIDQFLYMETTPGYEKLAQVSDVNAYLSNMAGVFNSQTNGYGIWTYRDYADNIIYNPEFGQGEKGWKFFNASVEDMGGNRKAHLEKGGYISQELLGRGFSNSFNTKAQITVATEENGKINITVGGESRSTDIVPGSQTVTIDFAKQVKGDIRISADVPVSVDNVKLYSHITEGNIYKLDGTPGGYLTGIRTLNSKMK